MAGFPVIDTEGGSYVTGVDVVPVTARRCGGGKGTMDGDPAVKVDGEEEERPDFGPSLLLCHQSRHGDVYAQLLSVHSRRDGTPRAPIQSK